jgi:hypothetical protein
MPGSGRGGLCCYVSRYHRIRTRWTTARRRVRAENSYCRNCGCAARAFPNLDYADQNGLVHCHCHAPYLRHTQHDSFCDNDAVENESSSFDPNRPKAFLRSYGNLDADRDSNPRGDPCIQQHASLRPELHAAAQSECHVRSANGDSLYADSANVDPANENSGYPYEYEATFHAATLPDTSPDFYSAAEHSRATHSHESA